MEMLVTYLENVIRFSYTGRVSKVPQELIEAAAKPSPV